MIRTGAQRVMGILVNNLIDENEIILVNDFSLDQKVPQYNIDKRVIRMYLQEKNTGNPLVKNVIRIRKLREIIYKESPDLVVSFLGRTNIRMLISTIGMTTKKIVSVRNDPEKEYGNSKITRFFTNLLFLAADGCVFQTQEAKLYFWNNNLKKSAIIYNPIDDVFFHTNKKTTNTHSIVTFGRIEKQKNHKLLIDAFALIVDQYRDSRLYIYGEGQYRDYLEKYCQMNPKISGKVFFPGNVRNVNDILASSSMFILSSDYEGMPNALMESMAMGVPSISTDCPCGGPRFLIRNEEEGILVPCGDAYSIADAIRKYFDDNSYYELVEKNSKKRAEEFQIPNIVQQWKNYFYQVMG